MPTTNPGTTRPRRECGDCGHHRSVHRDIPGSPEGSGPGPCRLCSCTCYRQAEKYERITRRPVEKGVLAEADHYRPHELAPWSPA